ncbi:MAG: hypothetical protein M3321_08970 [Actinomycetota bacterium]|nr:hypothetical protein [Actinomycetota bacterium]
MIFVIGEPVWLARKTERGRHVGRFAAFGVAALIGGALLGGGLGLVGDVLLPEHSPALWVVVAALACYSLVRERWLRHLPLPRRHWQLPRPWLRSFWGGATIFGGAMGMGIFTITDSALFHLYLIGCLVSGDLLLGALFGAWYAAVFVALVGYGSVKWHEGLVQDERATALELRARSVGAFAAPVVTLLPGVWPFGGLG